jgi:hypothetical protein
MQWRGTGREQTIEASKITEFRAFGAWQMGQSFAMFR